MSPSPDDPQRDATYLAEWRVERWMDLAHPVQVFASTWDVEPNALFPGLDTVRAYVSALCGQLGVPPPRVTTRRGHLGRAEYDAATQTLRLPDRASNNFGLLRTVVLHELAHHLDHLRPGSGARPAHGPSFRAALVGLYRRADTPVAAHLLHLAFLEGNLDVTDLDVADR